MKWGDSLFDEQLLEAIIQVKPTRIQVAINRAFLRSDSKSPTISLQNDRNELARGAECVKSTENN